MNLKDPSHIAVLSNQTDIEAQTLVYAALIRSFSRRQVRKIHDMQKLPPNADGICFINPSNDMFIHWRKGNLQGTKIILLGTLDSMWADFLGIAVKAIPQAWEKENSIEQEPSGHFAHSSWHINYRQHELTQKISFRDRYLIRYDFTDEWNNHGYGRIGIEPNTPFALSSHAVCEPGAHELGFVSNQQRTKLSSYAILRDEPEFSVLWFNRAVGPIDSLEWTVVETFFSDYRSEDLICFPRLMETPAGFSGICTMRLDCDQAVASARPLFELYQKEGIPFSLAILTGLAMNDADKKLIQDVIRSGGAILSHSVNHLPEWGGNYETAYQEAFASKQWLMQNGFVEEPVYLVSPFHQNPRYAVKAMFDAGYAGFVSGIIHNDPEYLFARSGVVPFHEGDDFFSLSQQCMLHGDCFHQYGNSVSPYIEAFKGSMAAEGIFGYLDHPFSSEYQYGWLTEEERLKAHSDLIQYMKSYPGVLFCNLQQTMDFCRQRSKTEVWIDEDGKIFSRTIETAVCRELLTQFSWKGKKYNCNGCHLYAAFSSFGT